MSDQGQSQLAVVIALTKGSEILCLRGQSKGWTEISSHSYKVRGGLESLDLCLSFSPSQALF